MFLPYFTFLFFVYLAVASTSSRSISVAPSSPSAPRALHRQNWHFPWPDMYQPYWCNMGIHTKFIPNLSQSHQSNDHLHLDLALVISAPLFQRIQTEKRLLVFLNPCRISKKWITGSLEKRWISEKCKVTSKSNGWMITFPIENSQSGGKQLFGTKPGWCF